MMCFDLEHKTKNCFITVFLTFSFPTKSKINEFVLEDKVIGHFMIRMSDAGSGLV